MFVFGQGVQSAIESPRFATYSFPSSFAPFEYYPGRLAVEGRIPEAVTTELARRGHQIQRWPDWIWTAGAVCAILAARPTPSGGSARAVYPVLASNVAATVFAISRNWCRTLWSEMA